MAGHEDQCWLENEAARQAHAAREIGLVIGLGDQLGARWVLRMAGVSGSGRW